jgi:hypothetical protein
MIVSCWLVKRRRMEGNSNGMKRSSSENATNATRWVLHSHKKLGKFKSFRCKIE